MLLEWGADIALTCKRMRRELPDRTGAHQDPEGPLRTATSRGFLGHVKVPARILVRGHVFLLFRARRVPGGGPPCGGPRGHRFQGARTRLGPESPLVKVGAERGSPMFSPSRASKAHGGAPRTTASGPLLPGGAHLRQNLLGRVSANRGR